MNQQPDKFFREKLHDYQKPVSAEAWSRVSQNLHKRKNNGTWLRVAAAILLLATGTLLMLPVIRENPEQRVATNQIPVPNSKPSVVPAPEGDDQPTLQKPTVVERTPSPKKEQPVRSDRKTPPNKRTPQKENEIPVAESPETTAEVPVTGDTGNNVALTQEPSPTEVKEQSKNMTIVFTVEEVNEKYLTKVADAEATPEDKETSGFKKLLDKAYDLKHNQNPLGNLRQKKNEILAMNFRNDKRTQND